jgi:dCTP deaminase
MYGILSGSEIQKQVDLGNIVISPFNPKQLNPASYDLRLGTGVREYQFPIRGPGGLRYLDPRQENPTIKSQIPPDGLILWPQTGYLMHTQETVLAKNFVPIIDGKSSIGRLFTQIHFTAGFGDPQFNGQYTLEVSVVYPVKVYPNMRIGQIRFHTIVGDVVPYNGHYQNDTALGAIPSMSHVQFKEDV